MGHLSIYYKSAVFAILIALLLQTFNKGLIITDYYFNTESYAAHCENKANIQMQCNGKCQMIKKLKEEDKKDQQNPERKADIMNVTFFYSENPFQFVPIAICSEEKYYLPTMISRTIQRPHTIFHPPIA